MGKLDQYCFDGTNALSLKKLPTDSKKDQVDKETILAKTEKTAAFNGSFCFRVYGQADKQLLWPLFPDPNDLIHYQA